MFTRIQNAIRRARLPKRLPGAPTLRQFLIADPIIAAGRAGQNTIEFPLTKDDVQLLKKPRLLRQKFYETWISPGFGIEAFRKIWLEEDDGGYYLQRQATARWKVALLFDSLKWEFRDGKLIISWEPARMHELLNPPKVTLASRLRYKLVRKREAEREGIATERTEESNQRQEAELNRRAEELFDSTSELRAKIVAAIQKAAESGESDTIVHSMTFGARFATRLNNVPPSGLKVVNGAEYFDVLSSDESLLARGIARWAASEGFGTLFSFPAGSTESCEICVWWEPATAVTT
jgi:hypothetical protein